MHGQVASVDLRCHRQVVKEIHELVVHFLVVVLDGLRPKVEILRTLARLVVASEHDDVVGARDLHRANVGYDLWPIHASVDVIPHEHQLVNTAAVLFHLFKHVKEVVELSVDVSDNRHVAIDSAHVRLPRYVLLRPEQDGHQAGLGKFAALLDPVLDQL